MAGDPVIWKAAFEQTGIVPVANIHEWVDACLAFSLLPKTRGKRRIHCRGRRRKQRVVFRRVHPGWSGSADAFAPEHGQDPADGPVAGSIAGNPLDFWATYLMTDPFFSKR